MIGNSSLETMDGRRKWYNISQVLKEKTCQLKILYTEKISFNKEGEIKTSNEENLRELFTSRSTLKNG